MGATTMATLLTSTQAARHLGITESQLAYMRQARSGPDWGKVGRSIRYDVDDLNTWLEHRRPSDQLELDISESDITRRVANSQSGG